MPTSFEFLPTEPDALRARHTRAVNMAEVLASQEALRHEPIVSLATALLSLGLIDASQIHALAQEDPDLLRSKSFQLADRFLVTIEELHHALARTAGVVEVDALHFALDASTLEFLPMRLLRSQDLLVLG